MKQVVAIAGALALGACVSWEGGEIDDGGRAARDLENAPIAGPASDLDNLAEPWNFADGPIPTGGDGRGRGERAAAAVCDAERWSTLLGATQEEVESARRLPDNYRVVCFECPVTQDYLPDRVNFYLSRTGTVERVTCG